jgi:hypothetical protein
MPAFATPVDYPHIGDENGKSDVFCAAERGRRIMAASALLTGKMGPANSYYVSTMVQGATIVFVSENSGFVGTATNGVANVYLRQTANFPILDVPLTIKRTFLSGNRIRYTWDSKGENLFEIGTNTTRDYLTVLPKGLRYYETDVLPPNSEHTFHVQPVRPGTISVSSYAERITTPPAPPVISSAPAMFNKISLSWQNVEGGQRYAVYRRQASESWVRIGEVTNASTTVTYTDRDLPSNARYVYKVNSVNDFAESGPSNIVGASTLASPTLELNVTGDFNARSVLLKWKPGAGGASYYKVMRFHAYQNPPALTEEIGTVPSTAEPQFLDRHPPTGFLTYFIYAVNSAGAASGSDEWGEIYMPPATPANFRAQGGARKITLTWNTAAGAESYHLQRATTAGGPYETIAPSLTSTSYEDTDLPANTRYYYVVRSYNQGRQSDYSREVSASTQPE